MSLHLWFEPVAVFLTALTLRRLFGEQHLSLWLFFAAICLWIKEALNYRQHLRRPKHLEDIRDDASDTVEPSPAGKMTLEQPKPARTVKRERNLAENPEDVQEERAAELLRLLPPYSIQDAERNFRSLIKRNHPNPNHGSAEHTERSRVDRGH